MKIIDVRKLNAQKLYRGKIEFDYAPPEELMSIPLVKFASLVKVEAEYELFEDDALEITGKIRYEIAGQCSRCLKEASKTVEGELNALFEPTQEYEDYGYSNGKVDLTEAIDDAIMASMPFLLSCGEDPEEIGFSE